MKLTAYGNAGSWFLGWGPQSESTKSGVNSHGFSDSVPSYAFLTATQPSGACIIGDTIPRRKTDKPREHPCCFVDATQPILSSWVLGLLLHICLNARLACDYHLALPALFSHSVPWASLALISLILEKQNCWLCRWDQGHGFGYLSHPPHGRYFSHA